MASNPFDLGKRGGQTKARKDKVVGPAPEKHPSREWTPEEQSAKLVGYLEVPREHWEGIRYGTHVRYYSKTEGFRVGGFVAKNPVEIRPQGSTEDRMGMRLQNGFSPQARGYFAWFVGYDTIERLYMKPDAAVLVTIASLELAVSGLNANIRLVADRAKKQEARTAELEARLAELEARLAEGRR